MQHTPLLAVRTSSVHHKGVFAGEAIQKGQTVLVIQGKVLSIRQFLRATQKVRDNTYRLRADAYLSPEGTIGTYINHSCTPNCRIVKKGKRLLLVALRPIARNAEIFFDYATTLAQDDYWRMRCRCTSTRCRGVIQNYTYLPAGVLTRYRKREILPAYIERIPHD